MMNFKILNTAGIFALASIFSACTDENHAGVLTETESGTTIASVVMDGNGSPVVSAKVSLLSANHVAARMAPIKTATTDEDGKYTIDSVAAGDYALQISNTEHTQSAYQTITVEDSKTSKRMQASNLTSARTILTRATRSASQVRSTAPQSAKATSSREPSSSVKFRLQNSRTSSSFEAPAVTPRRATSSGTSPLAKSSKSLQNS